MTGVRRLCRPRRCRRCRLVENNGGGERKKGQSDWKMMAEKRVGYKARAKVEVEERSVGSVSPRVSVRSVSSEAPRSTANNPCTTPAQPLHNPCDHTQLTPRRSRFHWPRRCRRCSVAAREVRAERLRFSLLTSDHSLHSHTYLEGCSLVVTSPISISIVCAVSERPLRGILGNSMSPPGNLFRYAFMPISTGQGT
jgi:hypothetical protein